MSQASSSYAEHMSIVEPRHIPITMSHIANFKDSIKSGNLENVRKYAEKIRPYLPEEIEIGFFNAASYGQLNIIKYFIREMRIPPHLHEGWVIFIAAIYDQLEIVKYFCEKRDTRLYNGILRAYNWTKKNHQPELVLYLRDFVNDEDK